MKLTCSQGSLCVVCGSQRSPRRGFQDCIYSLDYKGLPVHLLYVFIKLPKAPAAHDASSGSHYLASIIIFPLTLVSYK